MQRYFADIDNNSVHLSKDDEHHITHVMRMRVGDQFEVVSSSKLYICEISSLSPLGVKILKEQEEDVELPIPVTLFFALAKGDKIDLVIQKATELGVSHIVLFKSRRCVVNFETKDIPKKLVPVFIGFAVKMLVQVICLIFIINLYLNFAAAQISPTSGNISMASFFEGLFICILSFILTSNAPKIAMTILTGQPQLSMGEFVSAAGAMAGGAMMAKNAAGSITSPAKETAKKKAHDWSERLAASKEAMENTKKDLKKNFSYDPNSKLSEKEQKKNYMNEHKGEIKSAGKNASNEVKSQQKANYRAHGGVIGSAGRLMAHYTGVAADLMNPKQMMLGQGRTYHTPGDSIDIHRIAERNQSKEELPKSQEIADTNANTKKEDSKNQVASDNKPQDPGLSDRVVE